MRSICHHQIDDIQISKAAYSKSTLFDRVAFSKSFVSTKKKENRHRNNRGSNHIYKCKQDPVQACTTSSFFDKLASKETIPSSIKKERPDDVVKGNLKIISQKSLLAAEQSYDQHGDNRKFDNKLTTTTGSFFHRLASADTFSSAKRKESFHNIYNKKPPIKSAVDKDKRKVKDKQNSVIKISPLFERLSSAETFSSARRKVQCNDKDDNIRYYTKYQATPSLFNRLDSTEIFAPNSLKYPTEIEHKFNKETTLGENYLSSGVNYYLKKKVGVKCPNTTLRDTAISDIHLPRESIFDRMETSEELITRNFKDTNVSIPKEGPVEEKKESKADNEIPLFIIVPAYIPSNLNVINSSVFDCLSVSGIASSSKEELQTPFF